VAFSHDLPPGTVKPLEYFNEKLVLWRGENGEVYLQDAFCLHLGAHRGIKGEVRGNDLMCPWHGWEWNGEGRNTRIPYSAEGCKKSAQIRTYPVQEWCGLVVMWNSHRSPAEPTWQPPEVPEFSNPDYYAMHPHSSVVHRTKMHPQMPMENAVDPAHIQYVHGADQVPKQVSFDFDDHWFQSIVAMEYGGGRERTRLTPDGPITALVDMNCYGVGISVIRWELPVPTVQVTGFGPVDDELTDYWFCQTSLTPQNAPFGEPAGLGKEFLRIQQTVIQQDFFAWANMKYLDRPLYAAEEAKAYSAFRRWAAGLYPEDDARRMRELASEIRATG
jgi:phenylpropionate dioxygenase-like ring-hydroxylating dioxygenase large terminal subunit